MNLYQIHSATAESGVLENSDVLKELARLKSEGVLIGLTLSGHRQRETLKNAMQITIDGSRLFDSVQATWNFLEPSAGQVLVEAHALGIGVIVKEALANGRLTDRNNEPNFASKLATLRNEARRLDTSVDALVLAACLRQPFADIVLSGAASVEQLTSNVSACHLRIPPETVELLSKLAEPAEAYWATRSKLQWN